MSVFSKSVKLLRMADTAGPPSFMPEGWEAYAGYVNGEFANFSSVVDAHAKNAHCFSIAVNASAIAACLDVEQGDATPSQAPGWHKMVKGHGQWKPCIYANLSTMGAVKEAMAGIPRSDYRLWVADQTGTAHIPEGYDGCQYDGSARVASLKYDSSVLKADFFPVAPPKPSGLAKSHVTYDLADDRFGVEHAQGTAHYDEDHNRWASAEIQVNVHTGHWRIEKLGWNKRPLKG